MAPPAGISYANQGVANWDATVNLKDGQPDEADLPMWRKALFMPGAKQMSSLAKLVNSVDFWKLRPDQKAVASQPGQQSPRRFIAAAGAADHTLSLIYVPEDRTLEASLEALPRSPSVSWFNPRTGEHNPAVAVVAGSTCQFPTPSPGDWLLVTKAGK